MSLGVVIGKFLPPHRGHELLLERALSECDEVVAIICGAEWHDVDAGLRGEWIGESLPRVLTLVVDQDELGLADDDTQGWARATIDVLGRYPDVVFTSEDYGPRYAALMHARHVMVDRARRARPISASAIRANPQAHLDWLAPHVRAHYVARVCVLGAESSGKTMLARALAAHYGVGFVGEFGRFYTEAMPEPRRYTWRTTDFERIAGTQAAIEDDAARWTAPPLIADTNPFVTAVFHEAYLGTRHPELEAAARQRRYDLFLICDPATPFKQDATGLRRDGDRRTWMHRRYCEYAESQQARVVQVRGPHESRCAQAVEAVDQLCRPTSSHRSSRDS